MARLKFSISLEIFKILNFFNLWALRVFRSGKSQSESSPNFSNFVPNFAPNFSPNFPRIF